MPKKFRKPVGRQRTVGRFFRGLPVVDATEPLRIVVRREDIAKGRRLDPNQCVFAQACKRMFDSHTVLFLRRVAYVELPDAKGKRLVHRFVISNSTADRIAHFDKTGEHPEGGFVLNAPSKRRTMEGIAAYEAKYRQAIAEGKHVPKSGVRRPGTRYLRTMQGVRDGRGRLGINYAIT